MMPQSLRSIGWRSALGAHPPRPNSYALGPIAGMPYRPPTDLRERSRAVIEQSRHLCATSVDVLQRLEAVRARWEVAQMIATHTPMSNGMLPTTRADRPSALAG